MDLSVHVKINYVNPLDGHVKLGHTLLMSNIYDESGASSGAGISDRTSIVHNLDLATKAEFSRLALALRWVAEEKVTGYIVTPTREVIEVRKGKRKGMSGRWAAIKGEA